MNLRLSEDQTWERARSSTCWCSEKTWPRPLDDQGKRSLSTTLKSMKIGTWWIFQGTVMRRRQRKNRAVFQRMITSYIKERPNLINTFVLVDCRHDPQKIDLEFMEWCGMEGIPFSIVFTKIDKLGSSALMKQIARYKKKLLMQWEELPPVFMTSAEGRTGREELLRYIDTVHQSITPNMYGQ